MKKLFRCLTLLLFAHLFGTTTYAMIKQKGAHAEQKKPKIKATGPYALYGEIQELLQQKYTPQSIVTALKKQKINVNAYENDPQYMYIGWTALHIAVFQQPDRTRKRIVQILIDAGADVNARINPQSKFHGCTPLHTTLYAGFFEYVSILMRAHADVNARINNHRNNPGSYRNGWRPLDVAACQHMVVRSLVAHGADIQGTLCKIKRSRLYQDLKPKLLEGIIHGKMDRYRKAIPRLKAERIKRTNNMQELTALFDKFHVLDILPAGVKKLAVAYDGGDHPKTKK